MTQPDGHDYTIAPLDNLRPADYLPGWRGRPDIGFTDIDESGPAPTDLARSAYAFNARIHRDRPARLLGEIDNAPDRFAGDGDVDHKIVDGEPHPPFYGTGPGPAPVGV